jgi:hypothetical protein
VKTDSSAGMPARGVRGGNEIQKRDIVDYQVGDSSCFEGDSWLELEMFPTSQRFSLFDLESFEHLREDDRFGFLDFTSRLSLLCENTVTPSSR